MRQTPCVLYIAIDALVPTRGKSAAGLDEFTAALDHAGIPAVWVTDRSRLEFDAARRKLANTHPFISEGGSGVYLPEGYFHLRAEKTTRLGRFTCIPVAQQLPAAADALEELCEEGGVPIVTLNSLSPRELVQNTGLPQREAELMRQRDFDELFFFAGASEDDTRRFVALAAGRNCQVRRHGTLRSLAVGANLQRCVQSVSKLYDRTLRYHPATIAVGLAEGSQELFRACDRNILLMRGKRDAAGSQRQPCADSRLKTFSLQDPDVWLELLDSVSSKGQPAWHKDA